MYESGEGGGVWNIRVKRNLKDWEVEEYCNLLLCLDDIKLMDDRDSRIWKIDKQKGFSVKSCYNYLCKKVREGKQSAPYKQIWQSKASPQISFFAWEAARECILTIDMLKRKGITLTKRCYLCKAGEESCNHILLTCLAVYNIWSTVYGLMGLNWVISETVSKELWAWSGIFMRKKYLFLVPLAIFWVMWKE